MMPIPIFKALSSARGSVVVLLLASGISAFAAPPDLTNGGVPSTTTNTNLGPTGLRGWVYHQNIDSSASRQILVQGVDAGSPAAGILAVNDVILGADGTGATPNNFTADARQSFANAINDAEARTPAALKVLRWRAGTISTQTLTLRNMGAYSATAPYNCPKSAKILEEGLQAIMTTGETAGRYSFGTLALLAGNNPANPNNAARQARAQTEARALIPDAAQLANLTPPAKGFLWGDPWGDGHKLVVLTEYYLRTGDALVLPAIHAYSKAVIGGQNVFGTYSHVYASRWRDGSPNGPMRNLYGTVNSTSMPGWLGLLLTKECGVSNPDLDPAIERASRFYSYYSGKGAIPYGEHDPYWQGHDNNGKSGLAALCYELESHRTVPQKFFAKMAVAATTEREIGHTGAFFNYLWSPIGAAAGGEAAAASHFIRTRWMFDLSRRWNGTFVYDCYGEGSPNGANYYDFRMSTAALLTYALPLRQLHITGRGYDPLRWLSVQDVAEAEAVDGYRAAPRTTSELVTDLGSWSPRVQRSAATELGNRPSETTALLSALHAMATDPQGTSRVGATFALGYIGQASSVGILAALLTDPVNHVRFGAAEALREMPQSARLPYLNTVLAAAASNAAPLLPFNEEDPAHLTHSRIGPLLFNSDGMVPADLTGVDRNLLYPAIRAVARNPVGACRSSLVRIYDNLNQTDYLALADTVVYSAYELTPADKMFAYGDRFAAQRVLEKFNTSEGVPLCLLAIEDGMYGGINEAALSTLELYAGGSKTVVPDPNVEAAMNFLIQTGTNAAEAQAVLTAIANDPNPAPLQPLKSIQSATADAPGLTLPAKWTTLRVASNDLAKGDSVYTWRKIHGAGKVTFAPNGTSAAKDAAVIFDGTPGQYLFEVTMSDSKNLTEVYSTVACTLYQSGGTLPPNNPPAANSQSPSVPQATATPIILTGSDPEGYALNYRLTSQPTQGTLTGTAPYLVYTSGFSYTGPDSFNFEVTDSEGQVSTATVNLTVTAASSFPVAVYEPFNMTAGTLLQGQAGGVGLIGNWVGSGTLGVTAGSLAYGAIPTSGNRLLRAGGNGPASIKLGTTLANAGLLNDGAVLWFSFLHREPDNNINAQPAFLFGSHSLSSFYNVISSGGSGIGLRIGSGKNPQPIAFNVGTYSEGAVQSTIGVSQTALIVGKITWGATPGAPDTIEIYTPQPDLILDTPTSISAVLNQSNFNVISMWGNGPCPEFDEIRFGPNYASVLNGNTPMTADTSAPAPTTMAFHEAPTSASPSSISMVAVAAYDPNGVEYYFTCTAGGGDDSGWQDSPSYTDTGLTPGVLYSYTVKARDKSPARIQTTPSVAASATISTQTTLPNLVGMQRNSAEAIVLAIGMIVGNVTLPLDSGLPAGTVLGQTPLGDQTQPLGTVVDLVVSGGDFTAPTPSPATFSVAPVATSSSVIIMTATTGSDPSGVEYLFTESSGNPGGSSSAWQDSPVFTDSGLTAATQYTYTVTFRDKSPNSNPTAASSPSSVTTNSIPAAPIWYWDGGTSDILTNGNGASTGGTGTWNTTLRNWDAGNIGHTAWNNAANKTAVFGGIAGTVTIGGGGVTVGDLQLTSATYTIKGDPLTVNGTSNLQINVAANIQSVLTGNFGLTKSGTGTLTLSAANTYTGSTTITGGTLASGATNFLPFNSNVAVGTGSTLQYAFSGNYNGLNVALNGGTLSLTVENIIMPGTFILGAGTTSTLIYTGRNNLISGNFTGTGNLNASTGPLAFLAGTNDYTGTTTLAGGGILVFTKPAALYNGNTANWTPAKITVNSGTALGIRGGNGTTTGFTSAQINTLLGNLSTVNNNGLLAGSSVMFDTTSSPFDYSGVISDSTGPGGGSLRIKVVGNTGGGLTLSGANTFTGRVEMRAFYANSYGSGLSVSSFNSVNGGNPPMASSSLGRPTTVANGTIDIGRSDVQASSTLAYTGTGETTDRILNIQGNGSSPTTIYQSGSGVLKFTSVFTSGGSTPITLRGVGNGEVAGLPGMGNLTKADAGTWTIAGASVANGTTTISGGTLRFAKQISLYNNVEANWTKEKIIVNTDGTLALNVGGTGEFTTANVTTLLANLGTDINNNGLRSGSSIGFDTTNAAGGAITIANNIANSTGTGAGAVGLRKLGTNTLILAGTNTYTGATIVNAGTLLIDGSVGTTTGAVSVGSGATLGGRGTIGGNLTVASGGKLTFDLSTPAASHDKLQVNGTVNFAGASELTITSAGGALPGVYTLSTGAAITGSAPTILNLPQGWNATVSIVGNDLRFAFTSVSNDSPLAPTNLAAAAGNNSVGLTWTLSAGAASYNVKRSLTSGGPYSTIGNSNTSSFRDLTAVNGTSYFYVVSAVNGAGESANSNQTSGTPTRQPSTTTLVSSPVASGPYGTSVTFTATVTVSSGPATGTVTFSGGATELGSGTLNAGTATFTTSALAVTNHSITATYSGDTNSAGSVSAPSAYSVTPKSLTITGVTAADKIYDGNASAALTGGVVASGVIGGETVTVVPGNGTFASANAGTWAVTATAYSLGGAHAGNYQLSAQPTVSNATITPRPVQLTGTRIYDGTVAAGILSISNNLDGANLSLSGSADLVGKNVGPQALIMNVAAGARVRSATGNTGTGNSTAFTVTIAAAPAAGNTMVAVISTRGTSANRVSAITQTGATWSRAAQATNTNGTTTEIWFAPSVAAGAGTAVAITQASLRSAAVFMEYSGVLVASSLDLTNNATGSSVSPVTGTTATTTQANELWVGGIGFISSTPTLGSILNTFTSVTNAQSTSGTAGNNARIYALERIVATTGTASSGGTLSVSAQWAGAIATFKTVKPTTLALTGSAAGNYTLIGASGTVQITPKALTITADNQGKTYGQTLAFGSGATQFTSSGLLDGETIGSVTLTCAGGDPVADAASYPITPSAATGGSFSATNYAINFVPGLLTVSAVTTTTTLTSFGSPANFGDPVTLTATVMPTPLGGTVQFHDNAVALGGPVSVSGGQAQLTMSTLASGNHPITAIFSGTANYHSSTAAAITQMVNKALTTISTAPTAAAITYGQTLDNATLSGGVGSVPGSFVFTAPATAPSVGTALHSVTFTPSDPENYQNATTSVSVSVNPAQTPFGAWAANQANGLTEGINDGPLDDPDHDGYSNLMEFVLGGAPMVSSQVIQPKLTQVGGNWVFSYDRSHLSESATTQVVEYGDNLSGWTEVIIPATTTGIVTIIPGTPSDHVEVTLPSMATKGFVRLKVTQ